MAKKCHQHLSFSIENQFFEDLLFWILFVSKNAILVQVDIQKKEQTDRNKIWAWAKFIKIPRIKSGFKVPQGAV